VPGCFPIRPFTELGVALAWLGAPASLEAELDQLQAAAVGVRPIVRDLRAFVRAGLRDVTLSRAAASMGTTPRSLQRRLRDERVSFQAEVDAARIEVAQKRMLESEASISEIALGVGLPSLSRFRQLFRRVTGDSPAQWRARPR
jgi:AraC-like DNA-binding protein